MRNQALRLVPLVALSLGATSVPGHGQSRTRIAEPAFTKRDALAPGVVRQIEKRMARCIVQRQPAVVERLLAHSDATQAEFAAAGIKDGRLHEQLSLTSCLLSAGDEEGATELRFSFGKLRNNLAEEVYLRTNTQPLEKADARTEIIPGRFISPKGEKTIARERGDFSDCIVYQASAEADAVLRTEVESAAEKAAVQRLVPALSKCLSSGRTIELTVSAIRSYAAAGLWARSYYHNPTRSAPIGKAPAETKAGTTDA